MKWLAAGLTFVNFATICGLILGMIGSGLNQVSAATSFMFGAATAILAYLRTLDTKSKPEVLDSAQEEVKLSKRGQRRPQRAGALPPRPSLFNRYRDLWKWALAACFAIFAVRSFCWLLYIDGEQLRIQSPNNLGDLALHITHIRYFANGVPLWPESPIYVFSNLRYPAGADLFNALLCLRDVDLIQGLVWTGLLASMATFYAFYRWGGAFSVAGFLFNGGIAGFQFFNTFKLLDYQGDKSIAWKSIPLTMFVTQRGLLYAIPAGLLLLWHWREKFFRNTLQDPRRRSLPFWVELSLYATMPLFHVHTFLALSAGLVFLGVFGDGRMRKDVIALLAGAFLPATFFVWLITDHFHASSVLEWHPGWVQDDGDFARPFFEFWFLNFGILIPLVLALIGLCGWRVWKSDWRWGEKLPEEMAFLLPAAVIFILAFFAKMAPWGWDNLKIMIWAYFLALPFLWTRLIACWPMPVRVATCVALFGSGFMSLFGGLAAPGFGFADRAELDGVGAAVRKLPAEERFAAYPTYNHPLLLQGRKVVLGYPGHLWTQGFDYKSAESQLTALMQGYGAWRETARDLHVHYIFWGREEMTNYPKSERPWEKTAALIASGSWGAIYDLDQACQSGTAH